MVSTESPLVPGAKHASRYAVVVLDSDGVVRLASGGVMTLFGRRPQELIGQPVEWLVPAYLRTQRVSQWRVGRKCAAGSDVDCPGNCRTAARWVRVSN
jgi:PAS domain-containing protein